MVRLEGEGQLLRIFIGESDRYQGKPLYLAIVRLLRHEGIAGATVLRGIEGYGASSRPHTARLLQLSQDLPIIIEAIDSEERISTVLPKLDKMVTEGLVTLERAHVITYRGRSGD
jgi:uncharacterized protein